MAGGDLEELAGLLADSFALEGLSIGQGFGFAPTARTLGVDEAWVKTHKRLEHLDHSADFLTRTHGRELFHVASHAIPGELASAFAAEWSDAVIGLLPSAFGAPIFYAFYRRAGHFESEELEALRLVQPALARSLETRSALAAIAAPRNETLAQALGRVVTHLTVDPQSGGLAWAPGACRAIERYADTRLTATGMRRIERALLAVVARGRLGVRSTRFAFGLRAEIAWLPPEGKRPERALVVLLDDPRPAIDEHAPILELLSPRQRDVALAAARGASLPAIAASLDIGLETARSHLRAVYRTLGVCTRLELAAALASD